MLLRRKSTRTRVSRDRKLALQVSSPRIVMFGFVKFFRRFFKLGVALFAAVVVGFCLGLGWEKLFVENDEFLISELELLTIDDEPVTFLTHARLSKQANLSPNDTIFSVDKDELKAALLELPEITDVEVGRRLPGKLRVKVAERHPVAWIASRSLGIKERDRQAGLLLDLDGVPFPCASDELWNYAKDLPVISMNILEVGEVVVGEEVENAGLKAALDLVVLCLDKFEGNQRPAWVVVKDEIMMEMQTRDGVLATLSYFEQDRQIDQLDRLITHAELQGKSLAKVNLIPRRFVPVHYR